MDTLVDLCLFLDQRVHEGRKLLGSSTEPCLGMWWVLESITCGLKSLTEPEWVTLGEFINISKLQSLYL